MVQLPIKGSGEKYSVAPTKIIALGLNYTEHVAESEKLGEKIFKAEVPSEPLLFSKTPNTLCGPGDTIFLPAIADSYNFENPRTDYEGELVIIVGKAGKHIREADAFNHIYGYTCGNDVSQRNIQKGDQSGWFRGKCFDTFLPIGPVVVPAAEIRDPQKLALTTRLDGEIRQKASTAQMIFHIPTIVSFVSRNLTLEAGDLILTGTPAGVGQLAAGNVVEVEIEGIGTLSNPVENEPSTEPR
jgi:2-keto-4-pentenoate hydratase/2-oxohepta-3-ene-1,7-dioic acid hydratase in catechol pathway